MKRLILSFALFFMFGMMQSTNAQVTDCCPTGTIAGPNLVNNGNFEAGNTGFTSQLNFSSTCINTSYDVGQIPQDKCTNTGWNTSLGDHTSGSGRYMLIDGPSTANSAQNRVWQSSATVNGGSWYSFEFHLRPSITTSTNSNLRLQVNIAGSNVSGTIDPPNNNDWVRYCYRWQATSDQSILMNIQQIINYGGSSFDYGIDDISFQECEEPEPPCEVYAKWDVKQDEFCKFTFTNYSTAGTGTTIVGYHWDFGDGATSTDEDPCHFYSSPGTYYVCLTVYGIKDGECCTDTYCRKVENGCETQDCNIDIKDINVKYGLNCNVGLYVDVNANRPIIGYFWDFGDGTSGAGTDPQSHTFPGSGSYYVCVTVIAMDGEKCCTATYCEKVEVQCFQDGGGEALVDPDFGTTIKPATQNDLKISPNPATSEVNVEFDSKVMGDYDLKVVSLQGQVVLSAKGQDVIGSEKVQLETSQLAAGTYFVSVMLNGKMMTEKLVIQ